MADLDREIAAFDEDIDILTKHHNEKWVVYHDGAFVNAFDSFDKAASEAVNNFGSGPYLIRQVGAPKFTLPASVVYRPIYDNC